MATKIFVSEMPKNADGCPFHSDDGISMKCCKIQGHRFVCNLEFGNQCEYLEELPLDEMLDKAREEGFLEGQRNMLEAQL